VPPDRLLRDLACAPDDLVLLQPDARASLLVLRPRSASPAFDPAALELESVFVDGRERAPSPR
jgi:hypothetical protein